VDGQLVDMARTPAEKKAAEKLYSIPSKGPDYPYGLTIRLEDSDLKKLGYDELPDVGDECYFYVVCKVTSVRSNATENGGDRSVELQITEMGEEEAPADEAAEE